MKPFRLKNQKPEDQSVVAEVSGKLGAFSPEPNRALAAPSPDLLPPGQRRVLEWIRSYITEHQYPPSTRDIGEGLSICQTAAHKAIDALQIKGYLYREPGKPRTLRLK